MKHLVFDSEFFAKKIVQVNANLPQEHTRDADTAFFLADASDISGIQKAGRYGFNIVDIRVTLSRPTTAYGSVARRHKDEDVDALALIARTAHRITRYYEAGFDKDRCDDLYEGWIRNSCSGWANRVLVVGEPFGEPSGYVTVHLNDSTSSIGLIAVADRSRGQGFGLELVRGALDFAHSQGAKEMSVVTQGRNVDGQRLFQAAGFRTTKTEVWLHKWL